MEEHFIEDMLKKSLESVIMEKVEKEIEEELNLFRIKLENRKDNYIAEIMKGIRIYHERDQFSQTINYRIQFENIYRVER